MSNKNNSKKVEEKSQVKETKYISKKTPYVYGTISFLVIATFLYFGIYLKNNTYENIISAALAILYFAFVIFLSKRANYSNTQSVLIPVKIVCIILGCAYLFNFALTGFNYIYNENIHSQNVFDIEKYSTKILENNKSKIYVDFNNKRLFVIDESNSENKISEYLVYPEESFDSSIRDKTLTFYDLTDDVKFSYIVDNEDNEIVLQLTNDSQRYLAKVKAAGFTTLLESKDEYTDTVLNTDKLRIYQIPNPKLILVITNDKVQVSEYDTLKNVKDSSYIDRVYTFLSNHFDNKYMLSENATGELLAERFIDDIKINLYTIRCQSCTYLYGRSDLAEIIDGDTSYMFRLNIDSSLLKEGIENAEN